MWSVHGTVHDSGVCYPVPAMTCCFSALHLHFLQRVVCSDPCSPQTRPDTYL